MPGITGLIAKGFIDPARIAASGHSWGGYQVAYMATRTNLFACIESGAAVVNMFSATVVSDGLQALTVHSSTNIPRAG